MKLCALCLAQNRHISSRSVIRYTALEHYNWLVHSFPDTNNLTFLSDPLLGELNPAPIYVNLSVVHWRNSHPSQCVDRMVAPGGYALPSGPGHVHVVWTLNGTKFTPRHACRCAYKYGLGAIGPQFKDSVWHRFMELVEQGRVFRDALVLKEGRAIWSEP